jgi:hypothetical protein
MEAMGARTFLKICMTFFLESSPAANLTTGSKNPSPRNRNARNKESFIL